MSTALEMTNMLISQLLTRKSVEVESLELILEMREHNLQKAEVSLGIRQRRVEALIKAVRKYQEKNAIIIPGKYFNQL